MKRKEEKRTKRMEILFTEEEMQKIEEMAKKLNIPKGRLIRNLTLMGLEDARLFDKVGIFDVIKTLEKIKENITMLETKTLKA